MLSGLNCAPLLPPAGGEEFADGLVWFAGEEANRSSALKGSVASALSLPFAERGWTNDA
ncbi:MAG TPA: hypothetical protein VFX37_01935 [Pseudolabrys sp.]|nr:hypothetical protein [Pseudolabrys sp.]